MSFGFLSLLYSGGRALGEGAKVENIFPGDATLNIIERSSARYAVEREHLVAKDANQ